MADSIHRSNVHLGVDATEFVKGVNDSAASWKRFQKQTEQSVRGVETALDTYRRRVREIRMMEAKLPDTVTKDVADRMRDQAKHEYRLAALKEMEQRAAAARTREEYAERLQGDRRRRARELDAKHHAYMERVKADATKTHMQQIDTAHSEAASREAYMQDWLARRKAAQLKHDEQMRQAHHKANINRLYAEGDVAERVAEQTATAAAPAGMNRYSAVAMQAGFAIEDFAAQVGPMGIAGGLRAAANNLSMIAFTLGTPLHGAIVGITAALAGSFLNAWMNSTKALKDFNAEAERSIDLTNKIRKLEDQNVAAMRERIDVNKMDSEEVSKALEDNFQKRIDGQKELLRAQQDIAETQRKVFETMMGGPEQSQVVDNLINSIRRQGNIETANTLQSLQTSIYTALSGGNKEALAKAIKDWNDYVTSQEVAAEISGASRRVLGKSNPFVANVPTIDSNAEKLQEIADKSFSLYTEAAAAQQALDEAQKMRNALLEREVQLREQANKLLEQAAMDSRVAAREQFNSAMATAKEEAVTMNMSKAQRLLHDYQKRRNELLAEAAMLGDEELTRADAILNQLLQAEEKRVLAEMEAAKTQQKVFEGNIITQTGSGANAASQAMADALKQFMDRGNKPEDKNARMLRDELRAIRDLLANPNAVRVGN